jgi:hypothetical protein
MRRRIIFCNTFVPFPVELFSSIVTVAGERKKAAPSAWLGRTRPKGCRLYMLADLGVLPDRPAALTKIQEQPQINPVSPSFPRWSDVGIPGRDAPSLPVAILAGS